MNFPRNKKSFSGSSLIFTVAFIVVLLGFLGLAVYTGLNAYVQNELQNAASSSALVAASSMYDGSTDGVPVRSENFSTIAAQKTFQRILDNSPVLNKLQGQLEPDATSAITIKPLDDSVTVNAKAVIPTPFLALLGVETFQVNASGKARYVKLLFTDQAVIGNIPTNNGLVERKIDLKQPLIDGPGPDIRITNTPGGKLHGYIVEACAGNSCYDVGRAAKLVTPTNGYTILRLYKNSQPRMVIYGDSVIDLGATAPGFTKVGKASTIKIIDDGIPDYYEGGQHLLEMAPTAQNFSRIELYHYAASCSPTGSRCPGVASQGFVPMSQ